MQLQLGQHPAPSHVVAHLNDPHLLAAGALQYDVIDPDAGLGAQVVWTMGNHNDRAAYSTALFSVLSEQP